MYFDYILESEDTVLTDKVIENATYEACLAYGEEFMGHVEDYINLLEDKDHEPTQEFDDFIFENLSPYLENESKYMLTFLEISPEESRKQNQQDINQMGQDKKAEAKQKNLDRSTRLKNPDNSIQNANMKIKKTGMMQKVKNTFGGANRMKGSDQSKLRQKAIGGIGTAMKKGLLRATAKVGKAAATKFKGKEGFLGKVAAAGTKLNRTANTAQANTIRKNMGYSSKKAVRA